MKDKGWKSNDSTYIFLEKQDFIRCHFPNGWHRLIDSIGDGVQIDFPVKVRLFLSWSPKTHSLTGESKMRDKRPLFAARCSQSTNSVFFRGCAGSKFGYFSQFTVFVWKCNMTLIWDLRNLFGIKDETSVDLEISSKAATHQHDSTPMLASTTIIFILSKFF